MKGIIDVHSHVLPQMDDGSESVEQSVAMLGMMAQQGIWRVAATPHFCPLSDTPERFLQRRREAQSRLLEKIDQRDDLPKIRMGAEVRFFHGISESASVEALAMEESRCILTEMPDVLWTAAVYRELEAIYVKRGMIPVIAHVERYLQPFRGDKMLRQLEELPVMVQASAGFFLNNRTAGIALRMLREGRIHLLGSDCHDLHSRKPNLAQALEKIERKLGPQALEHVRNCQRNVWK